MTTLFANSVVLALAPHTDDVELGCGGTLARLIEEGATVHVAAFATAAESLPADCSPTLLRDEFLDAMERFQVPEEQVYVYGFPVRKLSYHRQEILEELVKLRRTIKPDLILLPASTDLHQDHQVLSSEGLRAFKEHSVWGYELPWNHVVFSSQAFVTLEERHLQKKWEALQAYQSQFDLKRPYFKKDFIEGLARVRGTQVRADYAECFEVIRMRF